MTKHILLILTILVTATGLTAGQSTKQTDTLDKEIRNLEQGQVDPLLQNDLVELEKHWAEDYTVNNPLNEVVKARQGPVRAGTRTYSSFVREIEKVLIHGKTVVVMGSETVVPKGASPNAGQVINRRFTDVWMNEKGKWKMVARHANVICQN